MKQFIEIEEAVAILDSYTKPLATKGMAILEAIGHRVSEAIYAPIAVPLFNKSAMDGYALYVEEVVEEGEVLKVIEEVFAGMVGSKSVDKVSAVKIMTGAPIPVGANAVIKKEEVAVDGEWITLKARVVKGQNICLRGEDVQEGAKLITCGKKLEYSSVGLLASCGIEKVKVYTKPRVAFISTGDEVCDLGKSLDKGKIYNSNKYSLIGRLKELGYEVSYVEHAQDGCVAIGQSLMAAVKSADIILTTGGVSVGDKDLLQEVVEKVGGEKLFWKILIKPGSAILCSQLEGKLVISLSGNPTAALTTFELLAKPVLEKLAGGQFVEICREKAILRQAITKESPQKRFIRGRVETSRGVQEVWITQTKSGNGILSSTIDSNCLIEIEAGTKEIALGDVVNIIKL